MTTPRVLWGRAMAALRRVAARWWANPYLAAAARRTPLPVDALWWWLPGSMVASALLAALVWVFGFRILAALVTGISLGVVLVAGLALPPLSASVTTGILRGAAPDPRRTDGLSHEDAAWGLALASLWRLRWLLIVMLALNPALVIGVLRLDVATFTSWSETVRALGDAAPSGAGRALLPDGSIPYFRLVVRAVSAGALSWVCLPLLASVGVTAGIFLGDPALSPLAALVGGLTASVVVVVVWDWLAGTPLLAGGLEFVRVILLAGYLALVGFATARLNRFSARLLV